MSDYLPEEALINILSRLPPKSLIKFRCVSKSWNSLISTPYFISLHAQQSALSNSRADPVTDFIVRRYSKNEKAEIYSVHSDSAEFLEQNYVRIENPFRHMTRFYYRIVGSSNGVLCLSDDLFGHTHSIFLWNPVIRRKVVLPLPKSTFESTWPCMCVLGFGFDVKNGDFKVVRVAYAQVDYGYSVPPKVEVYALSTGSWRRVGGKIPRSWMVDYFWTQAFVNGNVHWVAYRSKARQDEVENLIIVFDMSEEVFEELPLPDILTNELPFNLNAAVLDQSLAIYQCDARSWSKSCSIWVMKKYGDVASWSKLLHINVQEGFGAILGVRSNGDILLTARNGGLVAYNQDTKATKELGILGTKDSFYICSHAESLALLIEGEEAREQSPSENVGQCGFLGDNDEDPYERVTKGEVRKQSSMLQYLTAMLDGWFM
ncbi:F-box/kelch-repeat protein At3g23880-like [Sesamum indicum]|uniref:F-box/kelch-repeat protein At3g23880-like n=1 Tax=Sesamum indicum TaxID=4182 RepID=A0A6I9TE50_SESIN|nr:F-box/kelch-repeat protein At3g23880-like [Sesamum indicum]